MWYRKYETFIMRLGFSRSRANNYVYSKQVGDDFIYVLLYVDDMLLIWNNKEIIKDFKY